MIIPSFEEIAKITDSRYSLVMLVSQRARKIVDGDELLIDTELENPVSIAIEEVIEGAVTFDDNSDTSIFFEDDFVEESLYDIEDDIIKVNHIIGDFEYDESEDDEYDV